MIVTTTFTVFISRRHHIENEKSTLLVLVGIASNDPFVKITPLIIPYVLIATKFGISLLETILSGPIYSGVEMPKSIGSSEFAYINRYTLLVLSKLFALAVRVVTKKKQLSVNISVYSILIFHSYVVTSTLRSVTSFHSYIYLTVFLIHFIVAARVTFTGNNNTRLMMRIYVIVACGRDILYGFHFLMSSDLLTIFPRLNSLGSAKQ